MSVKLIATDLDGTLLQADHLNVSAQDATALARAAEKGVCIAIATGRTWAVMTDITNSGFPVHYAIMSNGAAIYDKSTAEIVPVREMPFEVWRPVYSYLMQNHSIAEIYYHGKTHLEKDLLGSYRSPSLDEKFVAELKRHITVVDKIETHFLDQSIEKISVLSTPGDSFKQMYDTLKGNPNLAVTSSIPGNMDITLKGVNKGLALKTLSYNLNLTADEVMVFGDAENDLEMLAWAKWSFAMANGSPDVKKIAHYMTAANTENGVSKAIDQYILQI